jgi:hypothetical protein
MKDIEQFYNNDKEFKEYVDKDMDMYGRTLEQSLESPITKNYYKYIIESRKDKITS